MTILDLKSASEIDPITLARTLQARLYVDGRGRVFTSRGPVAHHKLLRELESYESVPASNESPLPSELGCVCDGELTPALLNQIGRALHRRSTELEDELRRRPAKRRPLDSIMREWCEIDRLTARLALLHRRRRELAAGANSSGLPYLLDADAEAGLRAAIVETSRAQSLSPLIQWQARIVCWLSGLTAAKRYLAAFAAAAAAYPSALRNKPVVAFRQMAEEWLTRSEHEPDRALRRELADHIRRLPPEAGRGLHLSARDYRTSIAELCRRFITRCDEFLAEESVRFWVTMPAQLATLAAADDCTVPIPVCCFRHGPKDDFFGTLCYRFYQLGELTGRTSYADLLRVLNRREKSLDTYLYEWFCRFVDQGATPDDAAWVCDHRLYYPVNRSQFSVGDARAIIDGLLARGFALDSCKMYDLVSKLRNRDDLPAIGLWLSWIGSVAPTTLTKPLRAMLMAWFKQSYLPTMRNPARYRHVAPLLAPLSPAADGPDYAPLLERISEYRARTHAATALPKSLRKLIDGNESRRREREHLERRASTDDLTPAASARLAHLRSARVAEPDAGKLRRAAEEVFLRFGIEALDAEVRKLTAAECRVHLGDLCDTLPQSRQRNFAFWIDNMSDTERERLREIIAARAVHGRSYKRHLAENQDWISAAIVHGLRLDAWFDAETDVVRIGERTLAITIAGDLEDVFQMGTYFGTCLSQGDINEMSTLTNAYDTDKQVVFMYEYDERGERQVVGRQLLAITTDFKLLGYRCYFHFRQIDKRQHPFALRAMASYAGRLAARVGIEPANEGEAKGIGEHFWYDDGAHEWPEAARAAWSDGLREEEPVMAC